MDDMMNNLLKDFVMLEMQEFHRFCLRKVYNSSLEVKMQLTYEFLKSTDVMANMARMNHPLSKSKGKAAELRFIGNLAFREKKYGDAMKLYTVSVAFAPVGSQELAFAYANRSAVLISVGKHEECLLDINRAFQENYPEAGKQKLRDRKNKCIAHLQDAINRFKSLIPALRSLTLKRNVQQLSDTFNPEGTDLRQKFPVPKVEFKNKLIANASDKVKMRSTRDNKIGIVATANIKPGEIIAIEKPVAWNLSSEFAHSHCANCFVRTDALIHCPNCAMVMYCSARCRDQAFGLFHRIECQIFSKFNLNGEEKVLASWAVVRILLVVTKQGEELDKIMDDPAYKQPLSKSFSHNLKKVFNSHDFSSVLSHGKWIHDKDLNDYSTEFNLPVFRDILFWLFFLKQSTFFGDQVKENQKTDDWLTDRELYAAALLLRLSQSTFQYVREGLREISDGKGKPSLDKGIINLPIGHGLFPLINIFSHSCEPNAAIYSYENNLVCRSVRPIKAGEEVSICYFRPYYRSPRYERYAKLREKHNFDCSCRACQRNWPVGDELPVGSPKVVSDNVGAKKVREYSLRFLKLLERCDLDELATQETFEFLREYLSILDRRFEKPCREFVQCERFLDLSMALSGNYYEVF